MFKIGSIGSGDVLDTPGSMNNMEPQRSRGADDRTRIREAVISNPSPRFAGCNLAIGRFIAPSGELAPDVATVFKRRARAVACSGGGLGQGRLGRGGPRPEPGAQAGKN
jgi:hypothetical protein